MSDQSTKRLVDISSNKAGKFSDYDRALLNALESPKFHKGASSAGSILIAHEQQISGKSLKKNAQFQATVVKPISIVAKRHEPSGMVKQELANQHQDGNLSIDIYEEGEEEELLEFCRAEVARSGDLSPMHSRKRRRHT